MPLVTTLCVVGGYALNNSNFDLAVMAGFGLLGYIMTKARFPLAPLLLALILSGIIETNFRRALSIFQSGKRPARGWRRVLLGERDGKQRKARAGWRLKGWN